MTPVIVKQTKVFLQSDSDIPTKFTRLDAAPVITVDLKDWTDGDQPRDAWGEELDDKHIDISVIREMQKELRVKQKRQRSIDSIENQPILLADRIAAKRHSL